METIKIIQIILTTLIGVSSIFIISSFILITNFGNLKISEKLNLLEEKGFFNFLTISVVICMILFTFTYFVKF